MRVLAAVSRVLALPILGWIAGYFTMATLQLYGSWPIRRVLAGGSGGPTELLTVTVILATPAVYAALFAVRRLTARWGWFVITGAAAGLFAGFTFANSLEHFNLEHVVNHPLAEWWTCPVGAIGAWTGLAAGIAFGWGFSVLFERR